MDRGVCLWAKNIILLSEVTNLIIEFQCSLASISFFILKLVHHQVKGSFACYHIALEMIVNSALSSFQQGEFDDLDDKVSCIVF